MADYLEREAVIDLITRRYENPEICTQEINSIPAADVAPVVRCKGCKHYRNHPNGLCYLHTEPKANAHGYSGDAVCVEPDDFCSYGEPKEGDHA